MSIRAETGFSLADQLFNRDSVGDLADALAAAHRGFDRARFQRRVLKPFAGLAFKQRIDHIVTVLGDFLPDDFERALGILRSALPPPLDPDRSDDDFGEFIWVVPGEYVARHGCSAEHLQTSLDFLRDATQRFSSEYAIRPFVRDFPRQTLAFAHECAGHDHYHVRRLASEGIRPRLPWGLRVELPPEDVLAVLDRLHADPTRFVTRSVANNLNDLTRADPAAVMNRLQQWERRARQQPQELEWMTRHALRGLLKQGDAQALELLGYPSRPEFTLSRIEVSERVRLGESLVFRARLRSGGRQRLRLGLKLYYRRADGRHSAKVFAVGEYALERGETIEIEKRQPFRPITTRSLYPGTHFAELLVNGVARGKREFEFCA